jgi:RNA 2',3'-cyclic 3'-phosphodiesterase
MDQLRLFAAVPLPDDLKGMIAESVTAFKQQLPFRKWTHPDDYHITLKFLGATDISLMPDLEKQLAQCAAQSVPFTLEAVSAGTFGKPSAPAVLWAGVSGDLERLNELQGDVERSAERLGYALEDRPYRPHITIARRFVESSGDWNGNGLAHLSHWLDKKDCKWTVSEIVLYQTRLNSSPMYEPIRKWSLGTGIN